MKWQQRLALEPQWQEFSVWPLIDTTPWPLDKQRKFLKNQAMIAQVLAGESIHKAAKSHGVSPSKVSKLLARCLAGEESVPPALSVGLIPGARLHGNQRRSPLPQANLRRGAACSFIRLLSVVPGLQHFLDTRIKQSVRRSRRGENLKPAALHAVFIAYLEAQHWPRDAYPFNNASRGYESVRLYLKAKVLEFSLPREPKRTVSPRKCPSQGYAIIEIDEYRVDCHGSVVVELNDQMQPLRCARITLLLAIDVATGCILAFQIALTRKPTTDDMMALISQLITPWKPRPLMTPGLVYIPGAVLPSGLSEQFQRVLIGQVRLDNDLMHLSHQVRQAFGFHLGAAVNFGLIQHPKARQVVERAFGRLNIDIHRFPSTSGSQPHDPLAEPRKHKKKAPVVSLRVLEDVIAVLVTDDNVRALGNMGATTPLDQLQYQMAHHLIPLQPVPNPGALFNPQLGRRVVFVRRAPGDDHAPHINFERVSYRGPCLRDPTLINQQVMVTYHRDDIRKLTVSTLNGTELGDVLAPKTWQRFPHSLTTRKYINELIRTGVISRGDPLCSYFDYTASHRTLPEKALELVRIHREFGQRAEPTDRPPAPATNFTIEPEEEVQKALQKVPDWNPALVKNRR